MARASRMSVQKRQREQKKAEKAAFKREQRKTSEPRNSEGATRVADRDELEGYGALRAPFDETTER